MKTRFTTYHNPRCGKSRATLTLLQGSGIEPHIAGVSEDASDRDGAHHHSVAKLGIPPEQLVRKGEEMDRCDGSRPDPDRAADHRRRSGRTWAVPGEREEAGGAGR
jgi:arsenate reductase